MNKEEINIEFESKLLLYTKISTNFISDIVKMYNDKRMGDLLKKGGLSVTENSCTNWIKSLIQKDSPCFVLIEKNSNDFVGIIEITNIENNNSGYLRICIDFDKQNNNYGTESIKRILKYAKNILKLNTLILEVYDFNHRAIKCYKNVGFIINTNNYETDSVVMSIKL